MSRPPNSGPPVSYKTVPGRHRTQKWNVAKQYDYSGDDWGGYDGYDDYEGDGQQQAPALPAPPSQPNYPAQLPSQQQKTGRQMSFDHNDAEEQRQFRAAAMSIGPSGGSDRSQGVSPARSAVSGTSSGGKKSGDYPRPPGTRPRDFTNPDQVPPPLHPASRGSPALSASSGFAPPAAGNSASFPPRKSSISSGSPAPEVLPSVAKQEKELPTPPFVRPSDIYKRVAAEQERERKISESGSRPSMESIQREMDSAGTPSNPGWQQRPLSSVDEGPIESQEDSNAPPKFGEPDVNKGTNYGSMLPRVSGLSSFGSDWLQGTQDEEHSNQTPLPEQTARQTPTSAVPSYMRAVTTNTNASPSVDHAADILAERTHEVPISAIGRQPDALAHQPSSGYRSVVNRAFDHSARSDSNVPTRDNSQSTSGISRSESESTSGISPIMSRVPSSATAQARQQQQERDAAVPTINEEAGNRLSSGESIAASTLRQSSPSQSRSASSERNAAAVAGVGAVAVGAAAAGVVAGYRRSFDPPESGTSPAHTPLIQSNEEKRFSDGMAAEAVDTSAAEEKPQVADVPASEIQASDLEAPSTNPAGDFTSQPPSTGRARAGTNYSMRESDLADVVNKSSSSSNEQGMSPVEAAQEQKAEQTLFLQTHAATPTTPSFQGGEIARTASPATPASGRGSPVKSRVKEIAGKFQDLHDASRRNSSTSLAGSTRSAGTWSRMDSEENLSAAAKSGDNAFKPVALSRQGTGSTWNTNLASESEYGPQEDETSSPTALSTDSSGMNTRPLMDREASFRPQLPGGWVSYRDTPTPASEDEGERLQASTYDQMTPRASYEGQKPASEEVDLTPTTKKVPLRVSDEPQRPSHFAQAAEAGTALGAALLASVGIGHSTRDFGSSEPAQPVDQPETQPKPSIGQLGYLSAPQRPELNRGDTSATDATDATDVTSAASSVPPTPPAKDTPSMERGSDYYFTVTPLRPAKSREPVSDSSSTTPAIAAPRPGISPALSTWTKPTDTESDRLRKEIVRSLDAGHSERSLEDAERTQDALDAPENAQRVAAGMSALPPAETKEGRPGLLGQRFSWENEGDGEDLGVAAAAAAPVVAAAAAAQDTTPLGRTSVEKELPPPPTVLEPQPEHSPEIKPEMPYERPRSRGLHIMNADSDDEDDADRPVGPAPAASWLADPATHSEENPHLDSLRNAFDNGGNGLSASIPLNDEGRGSVRLPSYYLLDIPGLERSQDDGAATLPEVADEEQPATRSMDQPALQEGDAEPATPKQAAEEESSPTSPTSKQKIPPFREILAIKSSSDRIKTYDETRQTFADMNTGLSDWLSGMLAQHPEHASLSTPQDASTSLGNLKVHKSSPSLAKFTRQFSSGTPQGSAGQSGDSPVGASDGIPQRTPTKDFGDRDKLQQRGKDLMKNASVLGGRAQAGAKGLFAKGKNRFGSTRDSRSGGSKDFHPPPTRPSISNPVSRSTTSTTPIPRVLDRSDPNSILQPVPLQPSLSQPTSPLPSPSITGPAPQSQNEARLSLSSITGNPLSRTLSRLRDRSRSKSASRSRGGSRPSSMILIPSDLTGIRDEHAPAVMETGVGTSSGEAREAGPSAISPWDEPGAHLGPTKDGEGEGDAVPLRLGVLPSPTAATFASDTHSPPGTAGGESWQGAEAQQLDTALAEGSDGVQGDEVAGSLDGQGDGVPDAGQAIAEGETVSASREVNEDDPDDLYESTPVAAKKHSITGVDADDADELYESTPPATQNQWESDTAQARALGESQVPGQADQEQEDEEKDSKEETVGGAEEADPAPAENTVPDPAIVSSSVEEDSPDNPGKGSAPDAKLEEENAQNPASTEDLEKGNQISDDDQEHTIAGDDIKDAQDTASRRSSVSSIGRHDQEHVIVQPPEEQHEEEEPTMSSQAVPAGPIGVVAPIPSTETAPSPPSPGDNHLRTGDYLDRPDIPRQLSYEPLKRDSAGVIHETLDTSPQQDTRTEPEDDWAASTAFNTTTLTRHRKQSIPTPDRKAKRLSGFFKENVTPTKSTDEEPLPPIVPSQRGVEDVPTAHVDETNATLPKEGPQADEKQSRRRSSIFDAFRRSPSTSKASSKARNSFERMAPPNTNPAPLPPPVPTNSSRLTKAKETPQRASTTTTEPEKKKKRFSGIGSLFGRSSTTGHKTEHSKKLTKSAPSRAEPQSKKAPPRIESPDIDDDAEIAPPPQGWYAPPDDPGSEPGWQRYPPPQQLYADPRPGGDGADTAYSSIPEAFRPVDASYNDRYVRPIEPSGSNVPTTGGMYSHLNSHIEGVNSRAARNSYPQPQYPPEQQLGPSGMHSRQASFGYRDGQPSYGTSYRQGSYGSDYRQSSFGSQNRQRSFGPGDDARLSPQISGQSEWERMAQQGRNSFPSVSPVQTNVAPGGQPGSRDPRLGSQHGISHGTVSNYDSQQMPLRTTLPPTGTGTSSSRSSYYARQRRSRPSQSGSSGSPHGGYTYQPPLDTGRQYQGFSDVPRDIVPRDIVPRDIVPSAPPMRYGHAVTTDTPSAQRPVAYNLSATLPPQDNGTQQMPRSAPGHGSFDDEDTVEMRGVSYPGQEWAPTQWE